jgi:hypothetical protein
MVAADRRCQPLIFSLSSTITALLFPVATGRYAANPLFFIPDIIVTINIMATKPQAKKS